MCIRDSSHLFQSHTRCMDAASVLMDSMSALTLIPTLCLTLLSARMLGLSSQRRASCLPLQQLQWGFLSDGGGVISCTSTCLFHRHSCHSSRCFGDVPSLLNTQHVLAQATTSAHQLRSSIPYLLLQALRCWHTLRVCEQACRNGCAVRYQ